MSILRSALCAIGRHRGQWSNPGRRCEAERVCEECGRREERTRHTWGPFAYVAPGRCEQSRRCERCAATETITAHEWGPWFYYENEITTPQIHTCRRCHESERTAYTVR
ncbi:hypothetical protein COUCH_22280 [Couchioplanes caeruleus]|uniref:hypothetical protein n=1 Tax=Couchioplanes caeruleus TaxID=56438 RepID=UPI0020BF92C3|nr:hypothetical protein [Couchioplanes caeruleus]UQU61768.1 hypothetical protein COUCH_22280 [Couchioplanes caeruleus]